MKYDGIYNLRKTTERQMFYRKADAYKVYRNLVDKVEYPDFECWKADMLKSGVFEKM